MSLPGHVAELDGGPTGSPPESDRAADDVGLRGANRDSRPKLMWQKTVVSNFQGILDDEDITFDDALAAKRKITDMKFKAETRLMFMPGSWSLSCWRFFMVFIVIWTVVMAPLEIAFTWWDTPDWISIVGVLVDTLFIVDMATNFNVAYMHRGRLITNYKMIVKHYLRSWFIFDLLINLPWNLLMNSSGGKSRKIAKVLKLPKIFRLTRLFRVAREEAHYFGTAFAFAFVLLVSHYCACLWAYFLIDCDDDLVRCPSPIKAYFEALSVSVATLGGSDGWLRFLLRGELAAIRGDVQEWRVSNFDWSSIGVWADIYASCTCLCGFLILGVLFATIIKAMEQSDCHTRLFHERLWNLSAACSRHHIDEPLITRAKRHYHYLWSCGTDASRAILQDNSLSADLKRQFAFSFYGDLLRQVPFLASAQQSFLQQLCSFVEAEVFSPLDRIIAAGEANTELYFIAVGRVVVQLPDDGEVIRTLDEGSFFGEMGLLFPELNRTVDVIGKLPGWLLVVPRSALESLCTPELLKAFRAVALERLQHANPRGVQIADMLETELAEESSSETTSNSEAGAGAKGSPPTQKVGDVAGQPSAGLLAPPSALMQGVRSGLGDAASRTSTHTFVGSDRHGQNSRKSSHEEVPFGFMTPVVCTDPVVPDPAAAVAAASSVWRKVHSQSVASSSAPAMGACQATWDVVRHDGQEEGVNALSNSIAEQVATRLENAITAATLPLGHRLALLESRFSDLQRSVDAGCPQTQLPIALA